jgi:hypothetical protein
MGRRSARAVMIRRPSDPARGRDDGARLSTPTRDHARTPVRVASCAVRPAHACSFVALEIMLYGIAQALESAIRTTRPAHAPARLPFPSHARGVPCLGFVLSLRRRSSSVRRAPCCPAVHPHCFPPCSSPPLAVPRFRQGRGGASNAIPTAPPLTTATTTNATHPFPFLHWQECKYRAFVAASNRTGAHTHAPNDSPCAGLCAQACRATASRPICSCCRRRSAHRRNSPAAPVHAADPKRRAPAADAALHGARARVQA